MPTDLRFVFMADSQIGMYRHFSGRDDHELRELADHGIHVPKVPAVDNLDWDIARFRAAVSLTNQLDPAFAVIGGDMVNDPYDDAQYRALRDVASDLHVPLHWVPGNHDIGHDTNTPTADSMAHYRDRYGPDRYVVDDAGVTVVVVDTIMWAHPGTLPDDLAGEPTTQLEWLDGVLDEASDRPGPTIVCGHHPLFLDRPDEPDQFWTVPASPRMQLLDLCHEHGVSTWLAGHWHRNNVARDGDLEVVVTSSVGLPLGHDPSGLLLVEVSGDALGHRFLPLTPSPLGAAVTAGS